MNIKDRVYVKKRNGEGYWTGEIYHIEQNIATIWGIDNRYNDRGTPCVVCARRKLKEEDMEFKQGVYWEK